MRFQVVPAAYVLLRRAVPGGDELLLQLREGTGYLDGHWAAAAAGHVEAGESVLDAVREAAEEFGIGSTRRTMEPDRSADLRWYGIDALPEPVVPHELQVMRALRNGTLRPITTHGFDGPTAG